MLLVTGGTGFLGSAVVDLLEKQGQRVRVLSRRPHAGLSARGVEVVIGDVVDAPSLEPALRGVRAVLHLAGRVEREPSASSELYRVHVDGTRNVLAAAAKARVERFVHVSTSGTIAVSPEPDIADETADWALETVRHWPYYLSKIYAEKTALEVHARGDVPVVIVSPSLILGPGDAGLSSTKEIVRFLRREVPAVPSGGMNFVDVRDAAQAVLDALAKGRPGERYLVGGSNLSVEAFFVLLEKVSGIPAPTLALSRGSQGFLDRALSTVGMLTDRQSDEAVAFSMGGVYWYLDAKKARTELGWTPRPPEVTLRETVEWIRAQGPLPALDGVLGTAGRGVRSALGLEP